MPGSFWVVTNETVQTKEGPRESHTLFGGRKFMTRARAEAFKENLDCPAEIHFLDTVDISAAAQKLRALGVMGAVREGKNWRKGMVKYRHGRTR